MHQVRFELRLRQYSKRLFVLTTPMKSILVMIFMTTFITPNAHSGMPFYARQQHKTILILNGHVLFLLTFV